MTNQLTPAKLAEIVSEYFKDHFDNMNFEVSEVPVIPLLSTEVPQPTLALIGFRGGFKFGYTFFMNKWDGYYKEGSQHHRLEHLKGEWVRAEQKMILEKSR